MTRMALINPQNKISRYLSAATHIGGLLLGPLIPLLIYMMHDNDFVRENARNSANWQSSVLLCVFIVPVILSTAVSYAVPQMIISLLMVNVIMVVGAASSSLSGDMGDYPMKMNIINQKEHRNNSRHSDDIQRLKRMYIRGLLSIEEFEERLEDKLRDEDDDQYRQEDTELVTQ